MTSPAPTRPEDVLLSEGWFDNPNDFAAASPPGANVPAAVLANPKQYYANVKKFADGRVVTEWYQRGQPLASGETPQDAVATTQTGIAQSTREDFVKSQQAAVAGHPPVTVGGNVRQWNPQTGTYDIDLGPSAAGAAAAEPPKTEDRGGRHYVWQPNPGGPSAGGQWVDAGPAPPTAAEQQQQRQNAPEPIGGTLNTQSPQYGVMDPTTGQITWQANPNYQKPKPEPINAPASARWLIFQNADGTTSTEKNPAYQPPSRIERDPSTGKLIEITQDDDGKPVVRDVNNQTTIKPAQIPVLQARYGEIAQGLGSLAQQLNQQVAAGTMTAQERTDAFTAAHQQAQVQVDELNGILSNSRAIWQDQISQRGQTFNEAASRRSYAGSVLGNALTTGERLAESSGPGHGRAIAGGVAALLGMGQQYAQGMGGFPDMTPVPMPRALQQAASVGLPGFGENGAGPAQPAAGAVAPSPPQAPPGPGAAPFDPAAAAGAEAARQAASARVAAANAATPQNVTNATSATISSLLGQPPGAPPPASGQAAPSPPPAAAAPPAQPLPAPAGRPGPSLIEPIPLARPGEATIEPIPLARPGDGSRMQLLGQALGPNGQLPGAGLPVALGGTGWGFDPRQAALNLLGDGKDPVWAAAVARAYGRPFG